MKQLKPKKPLNTINNLFADHVFPNTLIKPNDAVWGVGNIIINDNGDVFMCKRSEYCDEPGTWCIPGGSVDQNEKPDDAVVRETFEEINLVPWGNNLINIEGTELENLNWVYETSANKCGDWIDLYVQAVEVSDYDWVAPEKIKEMIDQNEIFSYTKETLINYFNFRDTTEVNFE